MAAEIAEQPAQWRTLLADAGPSSSTPSAAADRRLRPAHRAARRPRHQRPRRAVRQVPGRDPARQVPAGLVSPSTMTAYGARPDLRGVLMIAVSQSGGSPDLVAVARGGPRRGRADRRGHQQPGSTLARAADAHVDVLAGPERAVAATKSYTAQLLALYLLLDRVGGGDGARGRRPARPRRARAGRGDGDRRARPALPLRAADGDHRPRLLLPDRARGRAEADGDRPTSRRRRSPAADLLHGPLAMIDPQVPVLAVVADGIGGAGDGARCCRGWPSAAPTCSCVGAAARGRRGRGRGRAAGGRAGGAVAAAGDPAVPAARAAPRHRPGWDPDAPRGLAQGHRDAVMILSADTLVAPGVDGPGWVRHRRRPDRRRSGRAPPAGRRPPRGAGARVRRRPRARRRRGRVPRRRRREGPARGRVPPGARHDDHAGQPGRRRTR